MSGLRPTALRKSQVFTAGTVSMAAKLHGFTTAEDEQADFERKVKKVIDWWATPRYKGIRRPYFAEDVVKKRGTLKQKYPSSKMAKKLFALLSERAEKGEPVHTSMYLSPRTP